MSHLQVFMGRNPVPTDSKHTDDIMFVWKELHLF